MDVDVTHGVHVLCFRRMKSTLSSMSDEFSLVVSEKEAEEVKNIPVVSMQVWVL